MQLQLSPFQVLVRPLLLPLVSISDTMLPDLRAESKFQFLQLSKDKNQKLACCGDVEKKSFVS